jgi:hypothetical protein
MAQWMLFGAVAALIGLVAFVTVGLGLVLGALLAGILSVATALASRRRRGGTSPYTRMAAAGREPEEDCVDLGMDAYTVRVVDAQEPPARECPTKRTE